MADGKVIEMPQKPGSRGRISARIDPAVEDDVRNAVLTLSGPPHFMNLSQFMEDALRIHSESLRRSANKGQPWPDWSSRSVKRGRPPKVQRKKRA